MGSRNKDAEAPDMLSQVIADDFHVEGLCRGVSWRRELPSHDEHLTASDTRGSKRSFSDWLRRRVVMPEGALSFCGSPQFNLTGRALGRTEHDYGSNDRADALHARAVICARAENTPSH